MSRIAEIQRTVNAVKLRRDVTYITNVASLLKDMQYLLDRLEAAMDVGTLVMDRQDKLHDWACRRYREGLAHTKPDDCTCWVARALALKED